MARPGQYLHRPNNTSFWYVRFVYPWLPDAPDGRTIKHSLRTRDKAEAERLKLPHVARHLKTLAWIESSKRNSDDTRPCTTLRQKIPNGVHELPGGLTVTVDGDVCCYVAEDGSTWEEDGNIREIPIPGLFLTRADYESRALEGALFDAEYGDYDCPGWRDAPEPIPVVPNKRRVPARGADELSRLVETYITESGITKRRADDARNALAAWNEISGGQTLRDCGRADGVKLREHLFSVEGNKLNTVLKKLNLLRSAIKHAIREEHYNGSNPFFALVTKDIKKVKGRETVQGRPFTEDDMEKVRASMANWNDPDAKLLWVLCATTGMRRGEAFLIDGEEVLAGNLRTITLIPTDDDDTIKNDESKREIPIPTDALPYLPARIRGRLFTGKPRVVGNRKLCGKPKSVGRRLLTHLRGLGILGRGKNLKSTRHRAARRMKNARFSNDRTCPRDVRRQILGHKFEDVHDGVYAGGYPMDMLKEWIDVIGLGPIDCTS